MKTLTIKHEGFSHDRVKPDRDNPREATFLEVWKEENNLKEGRNLLWNLISDPTQRDAQVAATVIQWLGSNVGMSFLREACRRNPKIRDLG